MNRMKIAVAIAAALAANVTWQAGEVKFTTSGNHYPVGSKTRGHAARDKRASKKRKSR